MKEQAGENDLTTRILSNYKQGKAYDYFSSVLSQDNKLYALQLKEYNKSPCCLGYNFEGNWSNCTLHIVPVLLGE